MQLEIQLNEFYSKLEEFDDCGKVCLLAISRAIKSRLYNILETVSPVLYIIFISYGNKCTHCHDMVILYSKKEFQNSMDSLSQLMYNTVNQLNKGCLTSFNFLTM